MVDLDDDLQEIIDDYQIENVRICEHCHKPHIQGFILNESENFCSKRCLTLHGNKEDEEYYWTEYL